MAAALLAASAAANPDEVVIANGGAPAGSISRPLLRGMFGLRLRAWPDGSPIRVFVLADDDASHVEFCQTVLQVYPYQLRQDWDRLVFSGTGQPPVQVGSEEELIQRVATTPGAIGYTSRARSESMAKYVKVLDVR